KFTLAFGLVFELPLALTMLSMMGIVTPQFLSKNRKYAILINFIIAAVLTPTPDIVNQTLMAGPLCILYEVGIIAARVFGRRRRAPPPGTGARPGPGLPRRPGGWGDPDPPPPGHPGTPAVDFPPPPRPEPVARGIRDVGLVTATPIQEAALPLALKGKDVA